MRASTLAACAALLGLAACAALDLAGREGACFSSLECSGGEQCILGECTRDFDGFQVDLWVSPLPASDYLPQPVRNVDLRGAGPVLVPVPPPVSISVESTAPVAFRATFTAIGELRRPLSFSTDVTPEQPGLARLVRGVLDGTSEQIDPLTYDVVVMPGANEACCAGEGPCVAPALLRNVVVTADAAIRAEPALEAIRIRGKVLVSETDLTEVANIQVQAFDPVSGIFSLPAQTDADGAFCLAVASPTGAPHLLSLRVGPSETRPTVEIPGVEIPVGSGDVDLGSVSVGNHGTPMTVQHRVVDAAGQAVEGVRVVFSGAVDPLGTFTAAATTDARGAFSVTLLRGLYTVRAQPPPDSPWATQEIAGFDPTLPDGAVLPASGIVLTERPRLLGMVLGPVAEGADAAPLAGVQVVAEPEQRLPGESSGRTFSTFTDADGAYTLRVDPGSYRFRFLPGEASGLPWAVGRTLAVDAQVSEMLLEPVLIELPVRMPGLVLGQPETGSSVKLGSSKIEVFGRTPSGWTVLVWEGRAGDDGAFEILLPRSLAGSFGATQDPGAP